MARITKDDNYSYLISFACIKKEKKFTKNNNIGDFQSDFFSPPSLPNMESHQLDFEELK